MNRRSTSVIINVQEWFKKIKAYFWPVKIMVSQGLLRVPDPSLNYPSGLLKKLTRDAAPIEKNVEKNFRETSFLGQPVGTDVTRLSSQRIDRHTQAKDEKHIICKIQPLSWCCAIRACSLHNEQMPVRH